jgi:transcriptional regulator with XRE-family HTH domain
MIDYKIIRIEMIKKEINEIELAKKLNINVNTLSRWLNGKNLININKFFELLDILELDLSDIKKS